MVLIHLVFGAIFLAALSLLAIPTLIAAGFAKGLALFIAIVMAFIVTHCLIYIGEHNKKR